MKRRTHAVHPVKAQSSAQESQFLAAAAAVKSDYLFFHSKQWFKKCIRRRNHTTMSASFKIREQGREGIISSLSVEIKGDFFF